MKKKMIFLDNASTTPVSKEVFSAMFPYFSEKYGNSSVLYEIGRISKKAVSEAKSKITSVLGCKPEEFFFTGSATESDNLAITGVARANKEYGNKIIISKIEHKGVLSVCTALEKEGFKIVELSVSKDGLVDLNELKKELDEKTILVSITMADSETGTIQPIKEISQIIKNFKKNNYPLFHTDASQSAQYLDLNIHKLGVDLMTISAHKIGGPKGVGGLFIKQGTKINPIIYGGGQQNKVRSGTENVPAIVGFGKAMEIAENKKRVEFIKIKKLRDRLEKGIFKSIPKVVLNGHPTNRLPNFLNVSFLDVEGEALLLHLDNLGIMVGTGSACNSESLEPSYILSALGNPYEFIHGSIRFSLGSNTKEKDIDYVLKVLPKVVKDLRQISPLNIAINQKEEISNPKAFVGKQKPHFLKKK